MKTKLLRIAVLAVFSVALLIGIAVAAEKIKGVVKSVDTGSGSIVVTDSDGKDVTLTLEDKGKAGKYSAGDKVKAKYDKKDGKNVATDFRKAEGC